PGIMAPRARVGGCDPSRPPSCHVRSRPRCMVVCGQGVKELTSRKRAASARTRPSHLVVSLAGGAAAAIAAGVAMGILRWTLVVRTIPERMLEWSLLFIPPDQFEAALLRFGFDAKRYALYAAVGGMLLLLAALAAFVL